MTVFVLWEDKAISPIAKFGPHALLIACVASRLGVSRFELSRAEAISGKPCAGNSKLLVELSREPLWESVTSVVAVLDTDEIHDRLPGIASRRTVEDAGYERWSSSVQISIRAHAPLEFQPRLDVCFLDRNLETLLSVIGHGSPGLSAALAKRLLQRDKLLHRAAADPALVSRACANMPSWEHLVATVTRRISASPA